MTLRILTLFPAELGINGDAGNVLALTRRAGWRGLEAELVSFEPGGALPDRVDLVHIGAGPLTAQRAVHSSLLAVAPALRAWAADGVPFLAIAGGWQLLGRELITADGERVEGAGVLPTTARLGADRFVGELLVDSPFGRLAGFENHSSTVTLHDGAEPLGPVAVSEAQQGTRFEGVLVGSLVGTNLHGPVLPMNPLLADALLDAAVAHARIAGEVSGPSNADDSMDASARELVDGYAARAREAIAARLR